MILEIIFEVSLPKKDGTNTQHGELMSMWGSPHSKWGN
jgi:hypothetical protein